jgi:hypothetical protein
MSKNMAVVNDNNEVINIIVCNNDEPETSNLITYTDLKPAGIGYKYDAVNNVFIAPQPYLSWTLDSNFNWQPPTAKPEGLYYWDEETLSWVDIETLA